MQKITAAIITIGDELLIGQTVDTNSAWMAKQLNEAGIWVHRRVAIGDDRGEIIRTLREESERASIILITGGLGPTADDITKPTLCEYFNTRLVLNPEALENVEQLAGRRGVPLLERNRLQAMVPEACEVIPNHRGSAPGMWFQQDDTVVVSMPGVPHEMKGMMETTILPRLQKAFRAPAILHRTILTSGLGESSVAERLASFEKQLPGHIRLAYLPDFALLKLRLTAIGEDSALVSGALSDQFEALKQLLFDIIVAEEDISLEAWVGRLLGASHKTVSTAESCTGGYIAHLITSVPGSSAYFKGSIISYANEIKQDLLEVPEETINESGAVSEDTVRQMVKGVVKRLSTDYAIAVSGIMGPDGGTPEKPVGTVWIAVGNVEKQQTKKFQLRYDRERNIKVTSNYALNMLRRMIVEETA